MSDRPPNVLFIFTDQQRADSLGIVNGWSGTPNLDSLAKEGTLFTSCFTNSPVCVPARYSLMSGLYPHNLGVQRNQPLDFPVWLETWIGRLRTHGYRTSMFGKIHLHPMRGDLRRKVDHAHKIGFDDVNEVGGPRSMRQGTTDLTELWDRQGVLTAFRDDLAERQLEEPWVARPSPLGLDLYYDTYVGRQAAQYLKEYDRPEPWCCYVGFPGPHEPWDAPIPWATAYDPKDMPEPTKPPRSLADDRPRGELDARLDDLPPIDGAAIAALRANYAGEVGLIDHLVGDILNVVRDRGEWDRTIIVFTSDHGEMNGDAGLLYKEVFLDSAVRVPLIIRDPMSRPTPEVTELVELMDVGPTVLELAGIESGTDFRMAKSVAGLIRGEPRPTHRTEVLSEFAGEVMLVTDKWKIGLNRSGQTYLLFDRSVDESTNLAGSEDFAEIQHQLESQVLQRLVSTASHEVNFPSIDPTVDFVPAVGGQHKRFARARSQVARVRRIRHRIPALRRTH